MNILEVENLRKTYPAFGSGTYRLRWNTGTSWALSAQTAPGKPPRSSPSWGWSIKDGGTVRVFGEDFALNELMIKQKIGFMMGEIDYFPKHRLSTDHRRRAPLLSRMERRRVPRLSETLRAGRKQEGGRAFQRHAGEVFARAGAFAQRGTSASGRAHLRAGSRGAGRSSRALPGADRGRRTSPSCSPPTSPAIWTSAPISSPTSKTARSWKACAKDDLIAKYRMVKGAPATASRREAPPPCRTGQSALRLPGADGDRKRARGRRPDRRGPDAGRHHGLPRKKRSGTRMKALLYKEFKLIGQPVVLHRGAASALILIPQWVYLRRAAVLLLHVRAQPLHPVQDLQGNLLLRHAARAAP